MVVLARPSSSWRCSSRPTKKSRSSSNPSRHSTASCSYDHHHHRHPRNSKKILRVHNLPHNAEAEALLRFLNQDARRFVSKKTLSDETRPLPSIANPVHNVLVFGTVALVGCSSVRVAETILHEYTVGQRRRSSQARRPRPLMYQGRVLELGRPRNYHDGEDSHQQGTMATTKRRISPGRVAHNNK